MVPSTISLTSSISQSQLPEIWHKAIIIPILKPARTTTSERIGAQLVYCAQRPKRWKNSLCPKYWHTSISTLFSTVNDHSRHCCRLLKKKAGSPNSARRARSDSCIRQCRPSTTARLCHQHQHTLNNLTLVLSTCRTDEPKLIFSKNLNQKGENRSDTRSSVSSALQLLSGRLTNTASEHQADQVRQWDYHLHIRSSGGWPNQWSQHIFVASAQLHQQQETDSVNGQICSNTFHVRYSWAPHTSRSEVGRPSLTARKEAKSARSDVRHPSHVHTTLQQYLCKSAATQ